MLVTKEVTTNWNNGIKNHYVSKGYIFTKCKEPFICKTEDLPTQSRVKIIVKCDYCGAEWETAYGDWYKCHIEGQDTCKECRKIKRGKTNLEKYGHENVFGSEYGKQKIKQTTLDKYGVDNINKLPEKREKTKKTCLEKYGVENVSQATEINNKRNKIFKAKYGKHPLQDEEIREKIKNTCLEKYGVENPFLNKEIQLKARQTYCKNNGCETSKPQLELYELLKRLGYNTELNYFFKYYTLDCYVEIDNIKIDVEFDGQYWHKDKENFDKKRNEYCFNHGLSVLRVKGNYQIPSTEELVKAIDKIKNGEKYIEIYTDWKSVHIR